MLKFNIGDQVRIIGNTSLHGLELGEVVTIADKCYDGQPSDEHYLVFGEWQSWAVVDNEVEVVS